MRSSFTPGKWSPPHLPWHEKPPLLLRPQTQLNDILFLESEAKAFVRLGARRHYLSLSL